MELENKIYLGVDWGEARIGLALADSEINLATPFKTVPSLTELLQTIKEEMVDCVVVGQPIKMRGEGEGISSQFTAFLNKLKEFLPDMEIVLVDERLSSQAADSLPGDKKTKSGRDEMAAMIILQNYLDKTFNAKC
jgi:putative Holliday junction resolvase